MKKRTTLLSGSEPKWLMFCGWQYDILVDKIPSSFVSHKSNYVPNLQKVICKQYQPGWPLVTEDLLRIRSGYEPFAWKDLLLCRMKKERSGLLLAVPMKHALRVRSLFKHCTRQSKDCRIEVTSSDTHLIGLNNRIVATVASKPLHLNIRNWPTRCNCVG
jgi:hypothetical protein